MAPGPKHYIHPRLTTLGQAHDLGLLLGQPARGVRAVRGSDHLYHELCAIGAKRHCPCVRNLFAAVVSYAEGGSARRGWKLTLERKAHGAVREKAKGRRHDEVWLTIACVLEIEREVGEGRLTLFVRQPLPS